MVTPPPPFALSRAPLGRACRRVPSIGLAAVLLAASPAGAAPRPIYGGQLAVETARAPAVDPAAPSRDVPAWLIRLHALEPLYRARADGALEPVLAAGPPRLEDGELVIPVRAGVVAHDGSTIDAGAVARWLEMVRATPTGPARLAPFMSGPVTGHRDAAEVRVPWAGDLDDAKAALRDPALRWWASTPAGVIGSGPFRVAPTAGGGRGGLAAFDEHRDGRPFLDAVHLSAGLARVAGSSAGHVQPDVAGAFEAAWYLAVGPELERRHPGLAAALDGALDRARLVGRFGATRLRPTPADAGRRSDGEPRTPPRIADRSLLALDALPADFVERLQLELTRVGVRVTVERVPASILDARRRDGAYDILVDRVVEPRAPPGAPGPEHAGPSDEAASRTATQRRLRQLFRGSGSTEPLVDLGVVELARGRLAVAGPPLPSAAWLDLANTWVARPEPSRAEPSGEPAP